MTENPHRALHEVRARIKVPWHAMTTFVGFLGLYFGLGKLLVRATHVFRTDWLSIDAGKVASLITNPWAWQFKHTQVAHPLFQAYFGTFGSPTGRWLGVENTTLLNNAAFGAAGLVFFLFFLEGLGVGRRVATMLTVLLGIGTVHLLFGSVPETFIFSFAGLALMPLAYVAIRSERFFVLGLVAATVFAVGVTITNIVFSILWLGARFWRHPRTIQVRAAAVFGATSLALFVTALWLQNIRYPPRVSFLEGGVVREHRYFLSAEVLTSPLSFMAERVPYFVLHPIVAPSIVENPGNPWDMYGMDRTTITPIWLLAALVFSTFVILATREIWRRRAYRDPVFVVLSLYVGYNFLFHMFYGSDEIHLYGAHYTFALVAMLAFAFRSTPDDPDARAEPPKALVGLLAATCLVVAANNVRFVTEIVRTEWSTVRPRDAAAPSSGVTLTTLVDAEGALRAAGRSGRSR